MSDIAVQVVDISKKYNIGARQEKHKTLRETLARAIWLPFRASNGAKKKSETIWALKDLCFEIHRGEVVGIVGRNGAGKSTLLKILSKITEPTTGFADIEGRVGSLLEVGTGFHHELTGRENIFLSGAILGMKRSEVQAKFDEIVAFAEIEKFTDTPVKHYSSGMYLRLAFAVAAHLEPEILMVDEVLAVGDDAFQKKCLGKMEGVAKEGRTVLFVSHNMAAIKSLCTRALLLNMGRLISDGSVHNVIDHYLMESTEKLEKGIIPDDAPRIGTQQAKIRSVHLVDLFGSALSQLYFTQSFRVTLDFEVFEDIQDAVVEVSVAAADGTHVVHSNTADGGKRSVYLEKGSHRVSFDMNVVLLPRRYSFIVGIHHFTGRTVDYVERVLDFTVMNVAPNGGDNYPWNPVRGYVRAEGQWHFYGNERSWTKAR